MFFSEIKFIPLDTMMFTSPFSAKLIIDYLESLCVNGQIQEDYTIVDSYGINIAYVNCPERKSLILKHNSKATKSLLRQLKKYYNVEHNILGQNLTYGEDYCECKEPSFYMLRGDIPDDNSPIVCGSCGMPVPLYKLPCCDEEIGYAELLSWHQAYITLVEMSSDDMLPTHEFKKELSSLHSNISQWATEYCKSLEELLKKPVYYHLYNPKEKAPRKCPICGKIWKYISMNDDENNDSAIETHDENSSILKVNFGAKYDWCACDKCRVIMDT